MRCLRVMRRHDTLLLSGDRSLPVGRPGEGRSLWLFGGRGKLSGIMGDAAKGIRAFKDGLKDDTDSKGPKDGVSSLPRTEAEKEELNR